MNKIVKLLFIGLIISILVLIVGAILLGIPSIPNYDIQPLACVLISLGTVGTVSLGVGMVFSWEE